MHIWVITVGEPVPVDENHRDRLHRSGLLTRSLEKRGIRTTWWTSTFDHFRKKHLASDHSVIEAGPLLTIRMLHGCGYSTNISLARLRDHRQLAAHFSREAEKSDPPGVIISAWPTIELSAAAVQYGRRHGVPVILDMRDMWPDIFIESLPPGFRYPGRILLTKLFRDARRTCSAAIAITGITEAFVDWGVKKARRTRTLQDISFPMGYPKADFPADKIRAAESFWDGLGIYAGKGFVACFLGSFGRQLDVECLIGAARILKNRRQSVKFVLCGAGDYLERYRQMADDVPEVIFPGWIDAVTMHVLMRRSSVGLDPLPNRYDFLATINNKAIEYMSAGLPVISSPRHGVLHDLLKRNDCGAGYASGNAEELAALLSTLSDAPDQLKTWSRNAAALFEETFVAEKVYDRMSAYLEGFATSAHP